MLSIPKLIRSSPERLNNMRTPALYKWLGIELIEVSLTEKLVSTLGSGTALFLLVWVTQQFLPGAEGAGVIASMGATAVLLFAVPHGALSQPWPVLGGHLISAVIGVICARSIPEVAWAAAVGVGLSIGAMHFLRCIHPPGGASALTAVLGGEAIRELGFNFVVFPVMLNAAIMVVMAVVINYAFRWRRYPAALNRRAQLPPDTLQLGGRPSHDQIVEAMRSLDSFVDISENDLVRLVELLSAHTTDRKPAGKSST